MPFPSFDRIRFAAYDRWQRTGCRHGADRDDWLAAEQDLLFALNYEVLAHHWLAGAAPHVIGAGRRTVCRFCERGAAAATFSGLATVVPEALGNTSLFTAEMCDECRERFEADIDDELAENLRFSQEPWRTGVRAETSVAAQKAMAKVALAIMPKEELSSFEDAIEWVSNPDHDFDAPLLRGLGGYFHRVADPSPRPWVALARRTDDLAPMPYMLVFLGTGEIVAQIPVPLCARDEDLDGAPVIVPRVCSPSPLGDACTLGSCVSLPVTTVESRWAAMAG
jgi:hypothetical protein